jgi:hypothetical protein
MRTKRETPETEPDFYSMPSVEEGIAYSTLYQRGQDQHSSRAGLRVEQRSGSIRGTIPSASGLVEPSVLYRVGMQGQATSSSSFSPEATAWLRTDGGLPQVSLAADQAVALSGITGQLAHPRRPQHAAPTPLAGSSYLHPAVYGTLPMLVQGVGPAPLLLPLIQEGSPAFGSVVAAAPSLPVSFLHQATFPIPGHGYSAAPSVSPLVAHHEALLGNRGVELPLASSRPAFLYGGSGAYQPPRSANVASIRSALLVGEQQQSPAVPGELGAQDALIKRTS